eukprot:5834175-Pyramimonas_sp.AAC.1
MGLRRPCGAPAHLPAMGHSRLERARARGNAREHAGYCLAIARRPPRRTGIRTAKPRTDSSTEASSRFGREKCARAERRSTLSSIRMPG